MDIDIPSFLDLIIPFLIYLFNNYLSAYYVSGPVLCSVLVTEFLKNTNSFSSSLYSSREDFNLPSLDPPVSKGVGVHKYGQHWG